jgi:hypothetical protein
MSHVTNFQRAHWAAVALEAFRDQVGRDDDETSIHDLTADLGHYCALNELDFVRIVANAISCWCIERAHPHENQAMIGPGPEVSIIIPGRKHPMRAWRQSATTAKPRRPKARGGAR